MACIGHAPWGTVTSFPSTVKTISAFRLELEVNDLRPYNRYLQRPLQSLLTSLGDEPEDDEVGRTAPSIPAEDGFEAADTNRNIVPRQRQWRV